MKRNLVFLSIRLRCVPVCGVEREEERASFRKED